ncbi:TetR/AcrR family transcriptional regulator [Cryobacterium sp. PH31-O1]|uniref:TetR/AcrR family transcriptional regulator n=1 Tax=Cryobacterium sp. PH31-O1 TaxID=3046306 RepID=UPI0024B998E3|nr:TetR/AcrR family transcriptional regulator [Cryobacterium sp. PH31-O1]MDJ0337276.1 TetR family transcriptional regulator [Cryobacterium sp. PH31-O1]
MTDSPTPNTTVRAQSREDKQHETTLRVERSAVSLVLEHGFDNVTVDMICSQSGISQRTFFNYFKTKKAAIIGAAPPTIDEGRAREFIAAPGDDLLPDVLTLMSAIGPRAGMDEQLFTDRLRIFALHPELMQEQMERMTRVTSEITDLVYLRLGRGAVVDSQNDDENDAALAFRHGQAELLTHAMLGVVRFMALQWIPDFERPAGADGTVDRSPTPTLTPTVAESLSRTIELLRRTLSIPGL